MSLFKKDPPESPWGSPLFVVSLPPAKSPEEEAWRLAKIDEAIAARPPPIVRSEFWEWRQRHPVLTFYASLYGFFWLVGWLLS